MATAAATINVKRALLTVLTAASLIVGAGASDIIPAPPQAQPIAIKGATIHPVSGPEIAGGVDRFR
jgi:hypothetical protein